MDEKAEYLLATIIPIKGNLIPTANLHDFDAVSSVFYIVMLKSNNGNESIARKPRVKNVQPVCD